MHKFLRAAGFSMYQKKKDIEKLLDLLETQPSVTKCVQIDEETNVCEMRTEIAPGIGLSIVKAIMDSFGKGYGAINHTNGVEFWFELDMK